MATAINDPLFSSRGKSMDLSRLNDAERRVLGLLAQGHTAKSIANAIGSTPAAVNERLREARRKTGVGSSRELARLLKAQENRDEQIGVGNRHPIAADISPGAADPRRAKTGVFAMIGLFVVAAAGAAALMGHQPAAKPPADPLVGELLQPEPENHDAADLYAKVRSEPHGPWAVRTEQQIRARLMALPLFGKGGNVLRVTCGNTLCEIAGTLPASSAGFGRTTRNGLPVPPPTDYLEKLGFRNKDIEKLGLKTWGLQFLHGQGRTKPFVFLLYYSRANARGPMLPPPPPNPLP
jgi:DNA-binding CsgD family transcriptional regulator